MIFSKFSYKKFEEPFLDKIHTFIQNNDLSTLPTGRHDIENDDLFVNIADYETTTPQERVWEAHRNYIDIHVMIKGTEKLELTFIENAQIKEYHEDSDYVEISDVKSLFSEIILQEGEYLVCFPEDVHKTACMLDEKKSVRKAIFKVKL